ncbi:short-chain dehydrogenase [Flavobacterium akiainvivens]|uniref:Short-chain dehydrogenase n=1 Tax=Flavobacterium akiainvivens TaxID=1202724 RepID=A0A0M8MCF1_9FLAO|nr:SDR family oxidoreductase [Flavobacterium akiainvivens]KOS07245.1 short-chain dehydrogenase [Flavobacterium akiainvivens]SFQ45560.1 NAD(P)-dependent dehydrogenase, short-chain alcohol dehydrogenase family [Flavobacterium akiainvivens]
MKTVLITGANRSIGLEIAKQLAAKGYFIYIGSRNLAKGEEVVNQLKAQGLANLKAIELDVTNPGTISAAAEVVEQEKGSLDILINNAGILGSIPQTATEADVNMIKDVFETNLFGIIQVTQAFLPLLKKSAMPRISNITSGLGSLTLHSNPEWPYYPFKATAYITSKAALNMYTIALNYELRDLPFKVNAIDPGYTATDFNHHQGPGSVHDAASFIITHTDTLADAPTGKFFSPDIKDDSKISPW